MLSVIWQGHIKFFPVRVRLMWPPPSGAPKARGRFRFKGVFAGVGETYQDVEVGQGFDLVDSRRLFRDYSGVGARIPANYPPSTNSLISSTVRAQEIDVPAGFRFDARISAPMPVGKRLLIARKKIEHALRPALGTPGQNRLYLLD